MFSNESNGSSEKDANLSDPEKISNKKQYRNILEQKLQKFSPKLLFKDKNIFSKSKRDETNTEGFQDRNAEPALTIDLSDRKVIKYGEISTIQKSTFWNTAQKKFLYVGVDGVLILNGNPTSDLPPQVEHVIDLQVCKLVTGTVGLAIGDVAQAAASALGPKGLSFELFWPGGNITLLANTAADREDWVNSIYNAICECVGEDERKVFGWRHQRVIGTMHAAVIQRDETQIKEILTLCERGDLDFSMVDVPDEEGYTPLHVACILRLEGIVKLIHERSDVAFKDRDGMTCLHWAAAQLLADSLPLLCAHVHDLDIADDSDRTPLQVACMEGRDVHDRTDAELLRKCVLCLVDAGADVDVRDAGGKTPLHYLASVWQYPALIALLDAGADVNAVTDVGNTALHMSCAYLPVKKGVGLGAKVTSAGSRASHTAQPTADDVLEEYLNVENWEPTLYALISNGANVNQRDALGRNPFGIVQETSSLTGRVAVTAACVLLRHGCRPDSGAMETLARSVAGEEGRSLVTLMQSAVSVWASKCTDGFEKSDDLDGTFVT